MSAGSVGRWGVRRMLLVGGLFVVWVWNWAFIGLAEEPRQDSFVYDPKNRRDPFVPLVRDGRLVSPDPISRVHTARPVLYGILWDPGGKSIALINELEARVGDIVDGFRVVEIRRDVVVVTDGSAPIELEITFEEPPADVLPPISKGR